MRAKMVLNYIKGGNVQYSTIFSIIQNLGIIKILVEQFKTIKLTPQL